MDAPSESNRLLGEVHESGLIILDNHFRLSNSSRRSARKRWRGFPSFRLWSGCALPGGCHASSVRVNMLVRASCVQYLCYIEAIKHLRQVGEKKSCRLKYRKSYITGHVILYRLYSRCGFSYSQAVWVTRTGSSPVTDSPSDFSPFSESLHRRIDLSPFSWVLWAYSSSTATCCGIPQYGCRPLA